jgi:hypothetical protein
MDPRIVERIERTAGVPGLVDVLADRLSPSDLQSLLLAVHRRRVAALVPAQVLNRYADNAFAAPSPLRPLALNAVDRLAFERLDALGFTGVELSPVAPLGSVAALATVDQAKVLTADRGCEVVADSTNSLALECALRRRRLAPGSRERIRLYASHRLVRGQRFTGPGVRQHFRLLALATAGRDEGSYRFQAEALAEHASALLGILADHALTGVRLPVTDLSGGRHRPALARVLADVAERHPAVEVTFDDARTSGYYTDACFKVYAGPVELGDGGFTTWTAQLLGNAKERLLVSCIGTERLVEAAGLTPTVEAGGHTPTVEAAGRAGVDPAGRLP